MFWIVTNVRKVLTSLQEAVRVPPPNFDVLKPKGLQNFRTPKPFPKDPGFNKFLVYVYSPIPPPFPQRAHKITF